MPKVKVRRAFKLGRHAAQLPSPTPSPTPTPTPMPANFVEGKPGETVELTDEEIKSLPPGTVTKEGEPEPPPIKELSGPPLQSESHDDPAPPDAPGPHGGEILDTPEEQAHVAEIAPGTPVDEFVGGGDGGSGGSGGSGEAGAPVLTSLQPATAVIGDPDFDLHVKGTGFKTGDTIVFAGQDEPTTLVSDTEVTTGVNMAMWHGADPGIQVTVRSADGKMSNALTFAFTDAGSSRMR